MAKRKRDSPPRPRPAEYLEYYRYGIQSQPGGQNIGPRNTFARTPVWDEIPPVTPRSSTLQIGDEHVHRGASYKQHTLSAQPHFEDDNKEDNDNKDDDNEDHDNEYDDDDLEQVNLRMGLRSNYSQDKEEDVNANILMGLVFSPKWSIARKRLAAVTLMLKGPDVLYQSSMVVM
ncbi:unnamed protein product [Alternaria sp. RS040]